MIRTLSVLLTLAAITFQTHRSVAQSIMDPRIMKEDISSTLGSWTGSITYLDYTSGEPFSMAAELLIKRTGKVNELLLEHTYPNEPEANSSDRIVIRKNGSMINLGVVKGRETDESGVVTITTEHRGLDDHKPATIRYTYRLGEETLNIRKDVRFLKTTEWIKRSEYAYTRKI